MFALLQFLLFVVAMIFFVALVLVLVFVAKVRSFFAPKRRSNGDAFGQFGGGADTADGFSGKGTSNVRQPQSGQRRKIIPADEGEYVDYEEVE